MQNIKLSEYRIGIIFEKDPLAAEQNNYLTKVVNAYVVYHLDAWPRNPTKTFKFKNGLFGATSVIKNSDKEKYVYSGYGITLDNASSWSFDNSTVRNVIIFGVDKSSSSHPDNGENNFLVLGQGPPFGINGSFGSAEKNFGSNFSEANTKFRLILHYNTDNSNFFINEKKTLSLRPTIKNSNSVSNSITFQLNFVLEVHLMDLALPSLEKYL